MFATVQLNTDLSGKLVDQKNYHAIIGSLLYLTESSLDIETSWLAGHQGNKPMCHFLLWRQNMSSLLVAAHRLNLWMKTQLADYRYIMRRIPIYCDSKSTIQIMENLIQHSRTKHIDIRYHFIKDHVKKGNIDLYFVESERQLADLFTKSFDEKCRFYLLSKIGMLDLPA
ncbi:hypothetical protein OSB04_020331 [Centaurea solstitialis]|uniref:Uncharacterized protein n=1 Tax=Centaurea solstitialis TaxID=347529 RepID=A0AA38SZM6_9ASTR|nr:hypothetical protein OSB04_020331 [Centaurea solstitialis]